jgi:hypothetical protein
MYANLRDWNAAVLTHSPAAFHHCLFKNSNATEIQTGEFDPKPKMIWYGSNDVGILFEAPVFDGNDGLDLGGGYDEAGDDVPIYSDTALTSCCAADGGPNIVKPLSDAPPDAFLTASDPWLVQTKQVRCTSHLSDAKRARGLIQDLASCTLHLYR